MAKCIICNSSHFKRIPQQHCPLHQDQCQHMYTYKKNWLVVSITFIVSCQTFFLRWQLLDLDNSLHVKAIAINPNKILKSEPKHATKCHSSNVADGSIIWHTISSFPQSLSFPPKLAMACSCRAVEYFPMCVMTSYLQTAYLIITNIF